MKSVPKSNATKSKKSKKSVQKPAWAITEKMTEDAKEKEIDDLLEFAYELGMKTLLEVSNLLFRSRSIPEKFEAPRLHRLSTGDAKTLPNVTRRGNVGFRFR